MRVHEYRAVLQRPAGLIILYVPTTRLVAALGLAGSLDGGGLGGADLRWPTWSFSPFFVLHVNGVALHPGHVDVAGARSGGANDCAVRSASPMEAPGAVRR